MSASTTDNNAKHDDVLENGTLDSAIIITISSNSAVTVFIFRDWVCNYYTLLLIIGTCICNPLSFVVFSRKTFRHTTTSVYLRFLSTVDLAAVLNGMGRFYSLRAHGIDLRSGIVSCMVSMFCVNLFLFCSSWTLVVVTLERVIAVVWPHRVKVWCSPCAPRTVLIILLIIMSLLSLPFTLTYGTKKSFDPDLNTTKYGQCQRLSDDKFISLLLWIFQTVILVFLPSMLLIVCNVFIVFGITRSRKVLATTMKQKHGTRQRDVVEINQSMATDKKVPTYLYGTDWIVDRNTSALVSSTPIVSYRSRSATSTGPFAKGQTTDLTSTASSIPLKEVHGISHQNTEANHVKVLQHSNKRGRVMGREASLTMTLVSINTTFILCNFPIAVYGYGPYFQSGGGSDPVGTAVLDMLNVLMYTNNVLNFGLYCITGTRFRRELQIVLRQICFGLCPCSRFVRVLRR